MTINFSGDIAAEGTYSSQLGAIGRGVRAGEPSMHLVFSEIPTTPTKSFAGSSSTSSAMPSA